MGKVARVPLAVVTFLGPKLKHEGNELGTKRWAPLAVIREVGTQFSSRSAWRRIEQTHRSAGGWHERSECIAEKSLQIRLRFVIVFAGKSEAFGRLR